MYWIWLFVAILLEVAATVFMKFSPGGLLDAARLPQGPVHTNNVPA